MLLCSQAFRIPGMKQSTHLLQQSPEMASIDSKDWKLFLGSFEGATYLKRLT